MHDTQKSLACWAFFILGLLFYLLNHKTQCNMKLTGDTDYFRAEGATTRKLSGKWTVKIKLWKRALALP